MSGLQRCRRRPSLPRPRNTSGGMCQCGRGRWVAGQRKCRFCRADWARAHREKLKGSPRARFQNTLTDADLDRMADEIMAP